MSLSELVGDTPVPELDLSAMGRPCERLPFRVIELLVEGLDASESAAIERTGSWLVRDDDDGGSTFYFGSRSSPVRRIDEAWAIAVERGRVPASWRDDPRRVFPDQEQTFFCSACRGMGATGYNYDDPCDVCGGRGQQTVRRFVPRPTSIDRAWMLAWPEIVETAEALAREALRRLPSAPAIDRVQWGRRREGRPGRVSPVLWSAIGQRAPRRGWDWDAMKGPAFRDAGWWSAARGLDEATREMLCCDVGAAWLDRAAGISDGPLEPVLRMWELGITFEELLDDRIVLERACSRPHVSSWRAHVPYGG